MKTSEDIAIKIRTLLVNQIEGLSVVWQRTSYEVTDELVIVPHFASGEGSMRSAIVKLNIHVPDIFNSSTQGYEIDYAKLNAYKKAVIEKVKNYYWIGEGINFVIDSLGQPIKEMQYNEHFVSVNVTANIREK